MDNSQDNPYCSPGREHPLEASAGQIALAVCRLSADALIATS
jgi:hypothetical protein